MVSRRAEFDLIRELFAPLSAGVPGALKLTDDAATMAPKPGKDLVLTQDALIAGVHFRPNDPPETIARKCVRVNLSDLAAMGARPRGVLLTLCMGPDTTDEWLTKFASGLQSDLELFDVDLLGGDTTAGPGPVMLSLTALGDVTTGSALTRAGAQSGDFLFVSGHIGDGTIGLAVLTDDSLLLSDKAAALAVQRYQVPEPRLSLGQALVGTATACADVSDGLVADAGHIAEASGLGLVIEAEKVPLSEAGLAAVKADPAWLTRLLSSGDDFELVFTAPAEAEAQVLKIAGDCGISVTKIGATAPGGGVMVKGADGEVIEIAEAGYQHR